MATRANIATSFQAAPIPRGNLDGAAPSESAAGGGRSPGQSPGRHMQGGSLEDPSEELDAKPGDAAGAASSASNLADLLAKVRRRLQPWSPYMYIDPRFVTGSVIHVCTYACM